MAIIRSIVFAAFVACLFLVLPGFASAQNVHEVRPAGADYVRIGVDGPTSMEAVVALARRITGDETLTADDVLANLPHARRYVCRVGGRQVYFGPDPEYGGRCPEDATRSFGLLRGATYRVPRTHGAVLPPIVRRTSRPVPAGAPDARVAELESRLRDVTAERDDFRQRYEESETVVHRANDERDEALEQLEAANTALETVRAELAEALSALAARPEPRTVTVTAPAAVSLNSPFYGRPLWAAFVLLAVIMIALLLIALWPIRYFMLRPHLAYRGVLEQAKTKLEGGLMETRSYLRTAEEDLKKEVAKTKSLTKRRKRLVRAVVYYRVLRDRMERVMADALEKLKELKAFQDRKDRIAAAQEELAKLRFAEEVFLHAETQVEETMSDLEEANNANPRDEKLIADLQGVLKVYEENLETLGDSSDLRAKIAGLVGTLERDMKLQCGLAFDTSATDQRLADWIHKRAEALRKLQAKASTYEALTIEIMRAERTRAEEHAAAVAALTRRELEEAFLAVPSQGEAPANGSSSAPPGRQPRPRRITEDFERQQATPALHGFITRLLDEAETRPGAAPVLLCDEYEASGLAVFLHNTNVVCPQLQDPIRLRDFPSAIEALDPAMLTERRIRPPHGPEAPANTSP
ncbi:hypothetical protein M0Q28_03905 [Patescibacteria group bacterium]|jgi:hypothetical protein|nr:hypothetical protein [Patescibacteria group bacterium]